MPRAGVFIDGAYLDKAKKALYGEERPRLDLAGMSDSLVSPTERLRTYYYHCLPYRGEPPTPEESRRTSAMTSYLQYMRRLPRFEVKLGRLVRRGEGFEQKRVDILLAVDLVRLSWGSQIDRAAVLTGDSDFVPAVQAAKDAGVVVKLFYFPGAINDELYESCDEKEVLDRDFFARFRL